MPGGLVMFRRRWGVATDDFVFPFGFEIFFRLIWLGIVLISYLLEDSNFHSYCGDSFDRLKGFLVGSMVLQGLVFVTATLIVVISSLGTLSDDKPRRHIITFLYARCFLLLPEAILAMYGSYYIITSNILWLEKCPSLIKAVCLFGVLSSILVLFITIVIVMIIFDPLGASQKIRNKQRRDSRIVLDDVHVEYRRRAERNNVWETRLRILCCCFVSDTDGNRSALKDVAQLFTEMFEVEMDVVPSDIAAGLVLLQRQQENVVQGARKSPEPIFDRPAKPLPWMTASNLSFFAKFALSIYGWPLFCYMNPLTGPCRLMKKKLSCSCFPPSSSASLDADGKSPSAVVISDNACRCHLAGLEAILDLPHVRILHCSFTNLVFNSPFFVAIDDDAKAIVISVRGTMSFMDAITDVMTHCDPIFGDDVVDDSSLYLAHRGILTAADNLLAYLEQSKILEGALDSHPDYAVVTTGHSLGAGVASILALKLRRLLSKSSSSSPIRASPPEVRCFAFSPPGGLLSVDAHKLSRECIMSVVLDLDFIPRLSFHTFVDLKERLILEIEKADEPKFEILAKGCWSALGRCAVECCGQVRRRRRRGEEEDANSIRSRDDEDHLLNGTPTTSYTEELTPHICVNADEIVIADNADLIRSQPKLYPPGQILLLKEPEVGIAHGKWVGPEYLQEIVVGTTMMTDHLPDRVFQAVHNFRETQKSGLSLV